MVRSAAVTMEEARAGVGMGLVAAVHVISVPPVSLGNSGSRRCSALLGWSLQWCGVERRRRP
jgi:hypothetical protein